MTIPPPLSPSEGGGNFSLTMDEIVIRKSRWKQLLLLFGCLCFVILGYIMIVRDVSSSRYSVESVQFYGTIGILLFGLVGLLIIYQMIQSKPALKIDKSGITNYSHVGSGYLVYWANIKGIKIITLQKQKMIAIYLKDETEIFDQVNRASRFLMKLNSKFTGTPALIPSNTSTLKLEDVLQIIKEQKNINRQYKQRLKPYRHE